MAYRATCTACLVVGAAVLAAACGQDVPPPPVRNLDGPTAIAYGCYGDLRVNGGDPEATDVELRVSAQPVSSCVQHLDGQVPDGQSDLIAPSLFAFVLQNGPGTIAVVSVEGLSVRDSDPLTPGRNAIPIGTLPVGLATDSSQCHMVTANAGSCDLSVLDMTSASDPLTGAATISRVDVTNTGGERIQAKPRAIVGPEPTETIGLACPATALGTFYLAYPECNLVAAVDGATGQVVAGIKFAEDGTAAITDGNVTCPSQCGSGVAMFEALARVEPGTAAADDGAERPVVLHKLADGSKLVIGAQNSPVITIVSLDAGGLPTALERVTLEGDVGVSQIASPGPVDMGGATGLISGAAGVFQFAYAITSDNTIRVINLGDTPGTAVECDTQVDPRFLHDERDVAFLSCMPVGGVDTPPRRASAKGPGIEVQGVPLSIAFTEIEPINLDTGLPEPVRGEPSPNGLVGTFGFVTTSIGFVFIINVDDDKYGDFENDAIPLEVSLPLAIPHQVRDFIPDRDHLQFVLQGNESFRVCGFENPPNAFVRGPRTAAPTNQVISNESIATEQAHQLPLVRGLSCQNELDPALGETPVSELHYAADVDTRELAFPDWARVRNESWFFTWEGVVSVDSPTSNVDGPPVRSGFFEREGDVIRLADGSAPFCSAGVRPFDIAQIVGCDPARGDGQCGIGETCFVHPEAPAGVTSGMCVDQSREDELASVCRSLMTSRRRYTVTETEASRLLIRERRRVLRTSPLDGCDDTAQCDVMYEVERRLTDVAHPIEREPLADEEFTPTWACEADPTRAPGPSRCVMTCESGADCEDGFACSGGYCVEGVLPPKECISSVQQYALRVGDAFAVVGERTGFLHQRRADTMTGACVNDSDANPLNVGRIPLRPPACEGDGMLALTPNPCSTTVDHTEEAASFDPSSGSCDFLGVEVKTTSLPAVRFSNPVFSMHLVNTEGTGDLACRADGVGELPAHSGVYPGYGFNFEIHGGFVPMFIDGIDAALPVQISLGPDGQMWILDQGDISSSTKGQVFVLNPTAAGTQFDLQTIR